RRANCHYVRGNLTSPRDYARHLKNADCVLHLAGIKGSGTCQRSPDQAVDTNIWGTHLLLNCAKQQRIKRFIFASSYWVYGQGYKPPFRESFSPRPFEMYGLTKWISENEIAAYGMPHAILRLGNVFGWNGGHRSDDLVSTFIGLAFAGKPILLDAYSS